MSVGSERGGATVLTVGAISVVVVVLTGVLAVAGAVGDVHRARAAADLAALAGAAPVTSSRGVDCGLAASLAAANSAVLTECAGESDGSVLVAVVVARHWPAGWVGLPPSASARARAGPVDGGPPAGAGSPLPASDAGGQTGRSP